MGKYHRPTELTEALGLLAAAPLTVAAGCTDLFPATPARALPGDILDITAIAGLRGMSRGPGGWRIGATTTWTDILRADLPPAFGGLQRAAQEVGSVQIQNAGTIAGNLCTASPAGDGVPCLLTLDAVVELRSAAGTRTLPVADLLTGARRTARRADELVSAILIPEVAGRGHFLKLGARRYLVISIAMVATRLAFEDGRIAQAAIAVGACGPVATRLPELEAALAGLTANDAPRAVDAELVAPRLAPIDDIRADADYRTHAATELIRRSLTALAAPAGAAA